MRYLYSFLLYLAAPFLFLRLLWRSRNAPLYRKRWLERLGFCPHKTPHCIWIHTVSLGETIAATPLIKAVQAQHPGLPLLITNMTPTGSARVKAVFGDTVLNAYLPYDWPSAIKRFLNRVNPLMGIIMETELWPNLFAECKARDIPLIVANARLSEKSARGYQRVKSLTQEIFSAITILAVQAQPDANRFIALGMPAEKVKVIGNIKFDLELPVDLAAKQKILREQLGAQRLIWIAASTHPGEEEIILAAHRKLKEKFNDALLILVPRHPERFDEIAALIAQKNFSLTRRSGKELPQENSAVYLADTMGEMLLMYSVCDVAFVGGSFSTTGGHNMLEPAALHKPVIVGPNLFNFAEVSEMMFAAQAMRKVENADELASVVQELFAQPEEREKMGEKAYQVVERNRGALKRQMALINGIRW